MFSNDTFWTKARQISVDLTRDKSKYGVYKKETMVDLWNCMIEKRSIDLVFVDNVYVTYNFLFVRKL